MDGGNSVKIVSVSEYWPVIGAPCFQNGRAYLYRIMGEIWGKYQVIQASNRSGGDDFGNSLLVYSKIAIVGALKKDNVNSLNFR